VTSPFILSNQPRRSSIITKAAETDFRPGQKVEYFSASNGRWIPCKVTEVDGRGQVQINVKQGFWIKPDRKTLRPEPALFGFLSKLAPERYDASKALSSEEYRDGTMAQGYARAREARKAFAEREKAEREGRVYVPPAPKKSLMSQVVGALDFQENIKEDQGLLASAGRLRRGEKMSDEQAGALSRKIVGTKAGFFGETVNAEGKYLEKGWVDEDAQKEGPWWKKIR